jgi:ATP-dependent Clp protease ATP-binding subunit ClpA
MDLERLTSRSKDALRAALTSARDRNHPEASQPHLLRALLDQPEGLTMPLLQRAGANPADVRRRLDAVLDALPAAYVEDPLALALLEGRIGGTVVEVDAGADGASIVVRGASA